MAELHFSLRATGGWDYKCVCLGAGGGPTQRGCEQASAHRHNLAEDLFWLGLRGCVQVLFVPGLPVCSIMSFLEFGSPQIRMSHQCELSFALDRSVMLGM